MNRKSQARSTATRERQNTKSEEAKTEHKRESHTQEELLVQITRENGKDGACEETTAENFPGWRKDTGPMLKDYREPKAE